MYEVINHANSYAVCKCEDGFYDTNGGFFLQLLKHQEDFLNKSYYFKIDRNDDEISLYIFKTNIDITGNIIVFSETETGSHVFRDGKITIHGSESDMKLLFSKAKNPEVLLSFISILLRQCHNYLKVLNFFKYCNQFDKAENISQVYLLIYNMFLKRCDSILSVFLEQDMFNMLICFLRWFNKNDKTTLSNTRQLIKVLKAMECVSATEYGPNKKSPLKISHSVIDNTVQLICQYGKESTTSFIQFIEVIRQFGEKSVHSYEQKDLLDLACNSIELLVEIKMQFPDTQFSHNVNYIFKQMFKTYEFSLTAEGIVEILRIWKDYLRMMDDSDPIYPNHVKESHDLVQETYQERLSKKQKHLFKQAVDEYRSLEYQDKEYHVIVPASSDELADVGKALHICVGSYAKAVMEKKTQILWVYTDGQYPSVVLEVKNNELKQAKTKSNNPPSPSDDAFIKKWCYEKGIRIISY